ncbi:MAG: adenylate cyclase, partial [Halothiobacillaceae bacterium]
LVDYVKRGAYGEPGELYDAAAVPTLMKSLAGALVEDEPVLDVYGLSLSGYAPVRDSTGSTVAIIGVDVFVNRLLILKQRVLLVTAAVFGVAILLMIAVSLFVARAIRRPLNAMVRATAAIAAGDLTTRLALQRSDEFGVLGRCFDSMAQDLGDRQLIRDIFGRYVSEDVAKILLKSGHAPVLGGEERVVTILFSDLRNYSTISERLAPVQIVNMLNRYLGEMNTIIDHHHGCVIEFLGDGILAVFGAPAGGHR